MMFNKFVFEENGKFFIDLNDTDIEFFLDIGDSVRFSLNDKKYFAKVINQVDKIYELCILN